MVDIIFPFLLFLFSFLIVYALLRKTKIFQPTISTVISFVIAFFFLSASIYYSENIMQLLAYSVLVLFIVFAFWLVYKGIKEKK